MSVNLFTLDSNLAQSAYTKGSLVAGRLCKDYDFSGAKTIRVLSPVTVPMNNYTRSGTNRYGSPSEMQDLVQELTLTQDRSFTMTIDKGNYSDQGYVKNAGKMLALQLAERAIPEYDKYVLDTLAHKAGTIAANSTKLTTRTICERISIATELLDDNEVPSYNRILFVSSEGYRLLKHSNELMAVGPVAENALTKGYVGTYDNMMVIKVPATRWPANVNFLIVHKNAATAPVKLSEARLHRDPPGISGNLLEGRQYYDCFIFAPRAVGVYAEIDTSNGAGTVCAVPALSSGTLSSTTQGVTIYYTLDGSDPRYSNTAIQSTSVTAASGTTVKAYCTKSGCYDSGVLTRTA